MILFMKGGKVMEELIKVVSNVGFPIAVAVYLLIRSEKRMEVLTESITNLTTAVDKLNKEINKVKK